MNFTQLRAFHLVADAGGYSPAARAQRISQPTLSAQVRGLESESGVALFRRVGRRVELTEAGRRLHDVTRRLFAVYDEAAATIAGGAALAGGHLRVGADSAYHVMPALAAIRRARPGFTFALRIGNSDEVLRQVINHETDVGVMARPTSDPRLVCHRIRQDRLILFVPRRHAWAKLRRVELSRLAAQDLVLRERGSITREVFEQRLAEADVRPGVLVEVESREGVREAVAAGFGIGVVFESEFGADSRFRALDIAGADMAVGEFAVCLAERRRLDPVRQFFEVAEATPSS
ncbi:MAG: LysR family transcriptional regulator [Alphaproteobacteria bacterium]|nr:LysR family transcriptional regulator [Alphaproteobacteria bacterium]